MFHPLAKYGKPKGLFSDATASLCIGWCGLESELARGTSLVVFLKLWLGMIMPIASSLWCGWYIFRPQVCVGWEEKEERPYSWTVPILSEDRALIVNQRSSVEATYLCNWGWQIRGGRWCLGQSPTASMSLYCLSHFLKASKSCHLEHTYFLISFTVIGKLLIVLIVRLAIISLCNILPLLN